MLRDSIDYKGTAVGKLFRRFLFPTVMGMVFSAVFVITDGIFVGRGAPPVPPPPPYMFMVYWSP